MTFSVFFHWLSFSIMLIFSKVDIQIANEWHSYKIARSTPMMCQVTHLVARPRQWLERCRHCGDQTGGWELDTLDSRHGSKNNIQSVADSQIVIIVMKVTTWVTSQTRPYRYASLSVSSLVSKDSDNYILTPLQSLSGLSHYSRFSSAQHSDLTLVPVSVLSPASHSWSCGHKGLINANLTLLNSPLTWRRSLLLNTVACHSSRCPW